MPGLLTALLLLRILAGAPGSDPFAFFQPSLTITAEDRRQLDRGVPLARVLPGADHQIAVVAAIRVNIDGARLVAWMRRVEELKKSAYVLAIGRFSEPPVIGDLAGLALDDEDLTALQRCRPGACDVKLSAVEMTQLRQTLAQAGSNWKPAAQQAFRRLLLKRVTAYLAKGDTAAPPYEDHDDPVFTAAVFARIFGRSRFLTERLPGFAAHLRGYPQAAEPGIESFVYWSKESVAGKAVASATHVSILRGSDASLPDAVVAGKQIYATHYINGSLGVTALIRGGSDGHSYLVYVNRSEIDMLGGVFGGLERWFAERRLKGEAAKIIQGLRRRLESGDPPPLERRVSMSAPPYGRGGGRR